MSKQDAQSVQQVLAGDTTAYEGLVDAYKGRIYALVDWRQLLFPLNDNYWDA